MIALMDAILQEGTKALFAGFVVFLRVGAAMAMLPAFGEQSVPQRVRLVLALCFTFIVTPAVLPTTVQAGQTLIAPYLLTEPLIGLALGLVLRLMVLALQMAGTIAAQSTSLSQIFGGAGMEPMPAMSHLMVISGLALAVMYGLHVKIAEIFIQSYDTLPPGRLPDAAVVKAWGVGNIASAFSLAFSLAAPFVVASLVYNVALGVINRAMPQLMVAFVGAPALTAGGLMLLAMALPTGLAIWIGAFSGLLADPFGMPR